MKAKIGIFQKLRIKNMRAQMVIRISDNVRVKLIQQYASIYALQFQNVKLHFCDDLQKKNSPFPETVLTLNCFNLANYEFSRKNSK